jgi:hypothetical protein
MTTRAAIVIAALLSAACPGPEALEEPMSQGDLAAYQACKQNSDCVHANNGCCDCANGGQDVAVNAGRLAAFRAAFACDRVGCTERGGQCGAGTVACQQGACVYRP